MKSRQLRIQNLEPRRDECDRPIELPSDYTARVQTLLPNFPEGVILQWFYEHPTVITEFEWLDYSSLKFSLSSICTVDLDLPCLSEHETIVQYRDYFLAGVESPRMNRLASYIRENKTWPIPPIVLENPTGNIVAPWGLKYSQPFDVIEGHHRLAVLYALKSRGLVNNQHKVWLVRIDQ